MKRKNIILTALVMNFLWFLNYTSLLISAGKFDFNDGTTQGWTLDQMYVTSDQMKFTPVIGYTLMNSNNELLAYTGSLLIGRSDQNDIYLESPDLSSNSNWQGIGGYSIDVKRLLYSPGWGDFPNIFFVQLQLKVIDTADNNKEKLFAEWDGSNFVFHDITTFGQLYQFTWQPSWLTDPKYKVKKIRIRITGPGDVATELWYRGSWNIDNVIAIGGSPTNNTNPGSNVQLNLGSGVNVTFDQVTGAGNTSLTTSNSGTPPPGGFTILPIGSPTYYSITTTATFTGNIKIGIQYNDAGLTSQQEAALKLQVYEMPSGQWKNITTSLDMNGNIIYGVVTHLSEFAIMFSSGGTAGQWELTNQPTSGTINCFTVTGVGLFAGTEAGGVFVSSNNGGNWNPANTGLTNLMVRALCANNAYTFAGTWGAGVFRTYNDGISWTPVNTGLSNLYVSSLYSSGSNLIAGTWGGIFLSTNNGSSWTPINTGLTETHIRSLLIKWGNFFAGTINGLFYSLNNGASWDAMNVGLTNTAAISLASMPNSDAEELFTGTDGGGVFVRTPNTNWTAINSGLSNLHIPYLCFGSSNLFAATWGGGVFLTQNLGATWSAINDGLTNLYVRALIVSGTNIFAGTNDGGIWRRSLSDLISEVPDIASNPTSWNYGSIAVGSNSDQTFVIKNEGTADLNVTGTTLTGTNALEFSIQINGGSFTLAPAAAREIMIKFAPTSAGSKSANLSISSNDPDENPFLVSLSGTGTVATTPDISSNPAAWNYGAINVGTNSDKTFVIKNDGNANLNVTATLLTGANATEFGIQSGGGAFTLAPAETRNVVVRFAPTSAGSKSASLSFSSNDPDENPFLVSFSGTGTVVTTPDVSSNPATWNYGAINVGTNSDKTFVIKNDGNANLNATATSVTGANATEFSIQSGGGAFTLAPAETRNVVVRFAPTSAGSKSASLSFNSNDPDENPFLVALSGTGTAVATIPINPVTASPQMAGIEFWVSIDVGTNTNPVTDLVGVSFNLNYTNTTYINYVAAEGGSFMGADAIFFPMPDDANGKVSIGISRKAPQNGVNGFGTVARVKLIADPATPNNTPLQLSISNVTANNSSGAPIALAPGSLSVTIQSGLIVWPGDTNNDGTADQADILPLGLHWAKTGPARQNASMEWSGQLAMFWTPQAATYADANGDGTVNQADVLPIGFNWNKTHTQAVVAALSPVSLSKGCTTAKLAIMVSGSTLPDQNFYIDIFANEVSDLFGVSFELIYTPASIIDPQVAEAGPNNLLGSDVIYFPLINKTAGADTGKVSVGISRKFGQPGVSGSGLVTRITAHMSATAENHFSTTQLTLTHIQANDASGNSIPIDAIVFNLVTDINAPSGAVPAGFMLYDNYPNPFNLVTTIAFQLSQPSNVNLSIYDLQGHVVRTLVHGDASAGYHTIQWGGCDEQGNILASGVYFVRIEAKGKAAMQQSFRDSKKMILMK